MKIATYLKDCERCIKGESGYSFEIIINQKNGDLCLSWKLATDMYEFPSVVLKAEKQSDSERMESIIADVNAEMKSVRTDNAQSKVNIDKLNDDIKSANGKIDK